ncbi:hypothetical protein NMY22_g9515 [Coprinellus aureogranulatus]|nr:hypothetical protein NMY22_g9515 [Coprinellus aureogranulatus]
MDTGIHGKQFVISAVDSFSGWIEARALKKADSEAVARFIYEDVICRFSCIPFFTVDGGTEFKGFVDVLFRQYHVTVVVSNAYHPESNGIVERSHQVLMNSVKKLAHPHPARWPLYLPATLLSMRVTTSRSTGMSPFFLLYGVHPVFSFDLQDATWGVLDWHRVRSTTDLIVLRSLQITQRDQIAQEAHRQQSINRQKSIENFNSKMKTTSFTEFEVGMWVLRHETWLDNQHGNKNLPRWSGPYIVHEVRPNKSFVLRELDGTVIRGHVTAHRLRLFFFRDEQTLLRTIANAKVCYRYIKAGGEFKSDHPDPVSRRFADMELPCNEMDYNGDHRCSRLSCGSSRTGGRWSFEYLHGHVKIPSFDSNFFLVNEQFFGYVPWDWWPGSIGSIPGVRTSVFKDEHERMERDAIEDTLAVTPTFFPPYASRIRYPLRLPPSSFVFSLDYHISAFFPLLFYSISSLLSSDFFMPASSPSHLPVSIFFASLYLISIIISEAFPVASYPGHHLSHRSPLIVAPSFAPCPAFSRNLIMLSTRGGPTVLKLEDSAGPSTSSRRASRNYQHASDIEYTPEKALKVALKTVKEVQRSLGKLTISNPLREVVWNNELAELQAAKENRPTMLIAVCGATGAGKSSILNAVLDDNIVPTSGMRACTSVVTKISYHKHREIRAEITFMSKAEWRQEVKAVLSDWASHADDGNFSGKIADLREEAKIAWEKIHAVYPFVDPGDLDDMTEQTLFDCDSRVVEKLGTVETVTASDSTEFGKKIARYIDSINRDENAMDEDSAEEGQLALWPLIKEVHVYCKAKALASGAVLVDLPGVADANAARANIAKEYLKLAKHIWILAPIQRAVDDQTAQSEYLEFRYVKPSVAHDFGQSFWATLSNGSFSWVSKATLLRLTYANRRIYLTRRDWRKLGKRRVVPPKGWLDKDLWTDRLIDRYFNHLNIAPEFWSSAKRSTNLKAANTPALSIRGWRRETLSDADEGAGIDDEDGWEDEDSEEDDESDDNSDREYGWTEGQPSCATNKLIYSPADIETLKTIFQLFGDPGLGANARRQIFLGI